MSGLKAIAFDFDGVLADTTRLHVDAWNSTLRSVGIDRTIRASDISGLSVEDFVQTLELDSTRASLVKRAKRAFVETITSTEPPDLYRNVAPILKQLHGRYRLAVVTVGERTVVLSTVRHHDIEDLFDLFVLEGDFDRAKPHPDPYDVCVRKLEVEPHEVAAIEDSPAGITSARAAGLYVVAVSTTATGPELNQADALIADLAELPTLLRDHP